MKHESYRCTQSPTAQLVCSLHKSDLGLSISKQYAGGNTQLRASHGQQPVHAGWLEACLRASCTRQMRRHGNGHQGDALKWRVG